MSRGKTLAVSGSSLILLSAHAGSFKLCVKAKRLFLRGIGSRLFRLWLGWGYSLNSRGLVLLA
jgi:hypothetical protein